MANEKGRGIIKEYEREISDIRNILTPLKNGRIKELTNVNSDGYLASNIEKLEKEINTLLNKIEYDLPSINEELSELFE